MHIERIEFKNLYSYGEQVQTLEYGNGSKLVVLKGRSGCGKSSLLSMPCLLLYGKLEKKANERVNKASVANRINKNGWIKGDIVKGNHRYTIERWFSPNKLKVYKDGEDIENYGTSDAQDFIDNEIVDFPQSTFTNMVSISMRKFKSFLSMTPEDRKQIIDRVFDLEIVNNIYNAIKKDRKNVGDLINADNSTLAVLTQTLNNATAQLAQLQNTLNVDEANGMINSNNEKIAANLKEIEGYNNTIQQLNAKVQEFQQKYNEYGVQMKTMNDQMVQLSTSNQQIQFEIKSAQDKIDLYNRDKCPTCGRDFKGYDEYKKQLADFIEQRNIVVKQINDKMAEYRTAIKQGNDYLTQLTTASNQIRDNVNQMNAKIAALNGESYRLKCDNDLINEKLNANNEFSAVNDIIEKTTEQIDGIRKNIDEKSEKVADLTTLMSVYSIDGVKQKVIANYLPLLNQEIAENLVTMNFPYVLEFDDKFDSTIKDIGEEVAIGTLSDGEMARVDCVILCSLFKLLKRRYPSINIFNLDETISSLSPEDSAPLLTFLKGYARENNLNCYVVSHTDLNLDSFDEIIEVEKTNGFSHFETLYSQMD